MVEVVEVVEMVEIAQIAQIAVVIVVAQMPRQSRSPRWSRWARWPSRPKGGMRALPLGRAHACLINGHLFCEKKTKIEQKNDKTYEPAS